MTASTTDRRPTRLVAPLVALLLAPFLALALPIASALAQSKQSKQGDDTILRAMIAGTRAFASGDSGSAVRHFDAATAGVGAVWGTSPEAQRARSLWYEEAVKPFKGDPYERVMAYYYRGLLYLQGGDWGNAQAAFRSAVQQDAFAEEEQHNQDAALPLFLQGWALQAQGSKGSAREAYRVLATLRPDFPAPDVDSAQPSVLLVAESGLAPRKVNDGIGGYRIRYFRGKAFSEQRASVVVDGGEPRSLYPMEDVYYQAATRGGRPIDHVIEGKARFASTNEFSGSMLTAISADLSVRKHTYEGSGARSLGAASDALGVVGIAALVMSARTRPAADTRYWDNLPDAVHVLPLALPPGHHVLQVTFLDGLGEAVPGLVKEVAVDVPATPSGPRLVWITARERDSAYMRRVGAGG